MGAEIGWRARGAGARRVLEGSRGGHRGGGRPPRGRVRRRPRVELRVVRQREARCAEPGGGVGGGVGGAEGAEGEGGRARVGGAPRGVAAGERGGVVFLREEDARGGWRRAGDVGPGGAEGGGGGGADEPAHAVVGGRVVQLRWLRADLGEGLAALREGPFGDLGLR